MINSSLTLCVGSNTHNNQSPGGDGQTGDAGEGTGGMCVCVVVIYLIESSTD